jgi:hypothetical protein
MNKYLLTILTVTIFSIGCKPVPRAGVVEWQGPHVGASARDIPFTATDGTQTTFHEVRAPIALIAFVSPPGDMCCWLSPQLLNLTNRFENLPVSVAQISMPQSPCPHGPGCVEMCRLGETKLFSFCDSDGIAWKAYGEPKAGTVILIDQSDKVVATGSLDNLGPMADKAYQMGKDLHNKNPDMLYRRMFYGTI